MRAAPWVFPYDRVGLPAATFSENSDYSVGLFVSDKDNSSLLSFCSMVKDNGSMLHSVFWPVIEEPVVYSQKNCFSEPVVNYIELAPREAYLSTLYISVAKVGSLNTGWTNAYDKALELLGA